MKRIIVTTLTLLSLSTGAFAQQLRLGIKAGMNFSELKSNDKWFNSENKVGYQAGVWGRIGTHKFHIQPEAYFTTKTAAIDPKTIDGAMDISKGNVKFKNIDVPILLGRSFSLGLVDARIQAGPLFSFVLKEKNPFGEIKQDVSYKEALTNYKKNFSSMVFGAGVDVLSFAVDLRYELGLSNISKFDGNKQKLNLWTVSVGYSLF